MVMGGHGWALVIIDEHVWYLLIACELEHC